MSQTPSHAKARWIRRSCGLLAVAFVALLAGGVAGEDTRPTELPYDTPGEIPLLNPKYNINDHKLVRIHDYDLQPRQVHLKEGELVAWLGYTPVPSVVIFEREVARKMVCHSLVNFSIKDDELRSAPIHPGEFASFCELEPGHYRYKVVRTTPLEGGSGAARRLEGEIIVEKGSDG